MMGIPQKRQKNPGMQMQSMRKAQAAKSYPMQSKSFKAPAPSRFKSSVLKGAIKGGVLPSKKQLKGMGAISDREAMMGKRKY